MRRHNIALTVMMVSLVGTGAAFGYTTTVTEQTARPGDTATFTAYVFADNATLTRTGTDHPDHWTVTATPNTISFPLPDDARRMPAETGYNKVAPIHVTVEVPLTAAPGAHPITVSYAETGDRQKTGTGMDVVQVQEFTFTVTVPGTPSEPDETASETNSAGDVEGTASPDAETDANHSTDERVATTPTGRVGAAAAPWLLVIIFELIWIGAIVYLLRRRG